MGIHLRATGRHLPYGITVLPTTAITPANQADTRFTYTPGGMEGWVDLGSLIAALAGIEPTTAWSQVRRPNRYTIKSPKYVRTSNSGDVGDFSSSVKG